MDAPSGMALFPARYCVASSFSRWTRGKKRRTFPPCARSSSPSAGCCSPPPASSRNPTTRNRGLRRDARRRGAGPDDHRHGRHDRARRHRPALAGQARRHRPGGQRFADRHHEMDGRQCVLRLHDQRRRGRQHGASNCDARCDGGVGDVCQSPFHRADGGGELRDDQRRRRRPQRRQLRGRHDRRPAAAQHRLHELEPAHHRSRNGPHPRAHSRASAQRPRYLRDDQFQQRPRRRERRKFHPHPDFDEQRRVRLSLGHALRAQNLRRQSGDRRDHAQRGLHAVSRPHGRLCGSRAEPRRPRWHGGGGDVRRGPGDLDGRHEHQGRRPRQPAHGDLQGVRQRHGRGRHDDGHVSNPEHRPELQRRRLHHPAHRPHDCTRPRHNNRRDHADHLRRRHQSERPGSRAQRRVANRRLDVRPRPAPEPGEHHGERTRHQWLQHAGHPHHRHRRDRMHRRRLLHRHERGGHGGLGEFLLRH